jgi:exodeoxyribonuclease VII small subunit
MKDKELDFEKALAELERTVEKLETGKLALSESLAEFEKGVKLARFLRTELDKAEKKVEILLKDDAGGMKAEPFDLDEAEEAGGAEEGGPADADEGGKKPRTRTSRKKSGSEGGDDTLPF